MIIFDLLVLTLYAVLIAPLVDGVYYAIVFWLPLAAVYYVGIVIWSALKSRRP